MKLLSGKALLTGLGGTLLLGLSALVVSVTWAEDKPSPLVEGDKHFEEKSYRKAYEAYEKFLKDNPQTQESFRLRLRMGHCQAQLGDFEKAEKALVELSDSEGLTALQRGRANYRTGHYFNERPHYYYENSKGEKAWGNWIPDSSYHDLSRQDAEATKNRLMKAFELLEPEARAALPKLETSGTETLGLLDEAYNAGLDAAAALQHWQYHLNQKAVQVDHLDENGQKQSMTIWQYEFPDKAEILKRLDGIVALGTELEQAGNSLLVQGRQLAPEGTKAAQSAREKGRSMAALGTYRKGCFLVALKQLDDWDMQQLLYHPDLPDFNPLDGEDSPLPVFKKVWEQFHDTSFADDAQYYVGYLYQQVGQHDLADKAYSTLIDDPAFADSTERSSALHNRQQLRAQRLSVRTIAQEGAVAPDKKVRKWGAFDSWYHREYVGTERSLFKKGETLGLWVETRNVAKFEVRALTFNLPALMKDRDFLDAKAAGLQSIGDGALQDVINRHAGEKVFAKEFTTGDDLRHNFTRLTFQMPQTLPAGAYLIEVDTGAVTDRRLVSVTETQLVIQTYNPDENLALVVDSVTGAPLANTSLIYKRWHTWWDNDRIHWRIDVSRYTTDEVGRARIPTVGRNDWDGYLLYAEVNGRYAFAQTDFPWWQRRGWQDYSAHDTRTYQMTDRPVYRPGDDVHGKIILRQRDGGEWRNVAGADFHIELYNPKGEQKLNKVLRAGKYGAVEYDLKLDKDAALGTWYYYLRTGSGNWLGSGNFQVEEYKKPEFEVLVTPPAKPVKLGQAVGATIKAEYYFGGPAAGADVTYKVYRNFYFHSVYFPRAYDWLYNWQTPTWYGTPDQQFYRDAGSELVLEGKGKLNENGELAIEWNTQKALADWGEYDHQYSVQAEVTDASRRTIEGSGSVKALRRAFFAFVDNKLGFYRPNDRLDVEVRTVTADDQAVQAQGKLDVYRIRFEKRVDDNGMPRVDEVKTLVKTHDLNTDERGLAFFNERVSEAGTFDLVYRTKDEWGTEIQGSTRIVVKAESWQPGSFRFGTLSLLPQTRVYKQGETARVLLASDFDDAWMLVSVMAGREVMTQSFADLKKTGGQLELELTIGQAHVPNFHINVLTVRNGELHTNSVELFVPPVEQFLQVEVKGNKEWYQPGEKGTITVTARDKDGKPVSAEFAVSIYDRAITYIMPDNTPNIIKHFYGDRRGYTLNFINSYQTSVAPVLWDRQKYEDHRWYGAPLGWGVNNWLEWERDAFEFDRDVSKTERFKRGFASDKKKADSGEAQSGGLRERAESEKEMKDSEGGGGSAGKAGAAPGDEPGAPAPAAKAAERLAEDSNEDAKWGLDELAKQAGAAAPRVRSDFRDTVFYSHSVITGPDGTATIEVTFPDNLTDWRVTCRGISQEAKVGEAFAGIKVKKNLILRDQAPRFFVEGDVVTLSGIIMNRYDTDMAVRALVTLNPKDTAGEDLIRDYCAFELFPETPDVRDITVPARGEVRVDWMVRMTRAGKFRVRMAALSAVESDATEKDYPCKVRGAEMVQATSGVIRDGETTHTFEVNLPEKMDPEQTRLDLQLSPSVAALAIDAVPYLLQYPYGCVEQTMSRFLPAVLVRKTLQDAGVSLDEVGKRRAQLDYKGIDPQAAYWYKHNPVFSDATMNSIIEAGIKRLAIFQHGDGGWGWWQGGDSDLYMSSYVVYGLHTAKQAGVEFDAGMLERGVSFIGKEARNEKNVHRAAYVAFVLSYAGKPDKELLDKVYDRRDDLTHLSRAMICMAEHLAGDAERARILVSNIEDYRREDPRTGAVYWDGGQQYWWWWNDRIETNAFVLQAITMVDPKNKYLEPHVRWLAQNRKGSRWNSTKDTSHAVAALMAYAKATGELSRSYTVSVNMDGKPLHTWEVTPQNIFSLQTNLTLTGSRIPPGKHVFTVERKGEGKVYYSSFCNYFSKEDRLKASGNEIHIERKYFKLVERVEEVTVPKRNADGSVTEVKENRVVYDRLPLEYGAELKSGDKIEVDLGITADNDYEYLAFEDFKPAGCEPVALRSGAGFAGGLCQNVELRDDRVAFFVSYMPQGFARLKYQLRCEIPGFFSALPTQGGSMYVDEVKANSEEFKLKITDK